jgi:histidyl-tRNA synthetase
MKPQLVAGTRDLAPLDVYKRSYIFDTIRTVFTRFGFQPIETPAMERLDTLTGKYGDEGDQLLYKLLNSGDFLKSAPDELLQTKQSAPLLPYLAEKGLRYDLTVPFARFVVMNQSKLPMPFKRSQIQPVWRAERNQKGRYREFYQCDADVVGSDSLIYEAELLQMYDQVFAKLGLKVIIKINNRKILDAMAQYCGHSDKFSQIVTAIDKLDKIGWDGVKTELEKIGVLETAYEKIRDVVVRAEGNLDKLKTLFVGIAQGEKGVAELEQIQKFLAAYTFQNTLELDFSLARGLSYYTGMVVEVVVDIAAKGQESIKMGSIGGGGRYDNLTEIFGLPNLSGMGISFGADRIYDVLEDLSLYPTETFPEVKVLLLSLDEDSLAYNFGVIQKLREANIPSDIYPKAAKFQKQMEYANRRNVPFVIITGESERAAGLLKIKNMRTGEQQNLSLDEIIAMIG